MGKFRWKNCILTYTALNTCAQAASTPTHWQTSDHRNFTQSPFHLPCVNNQHALAKQRPTMSIFVLDDVCFSAYATIAEHKREEVVAAIHHSHSCADMVWIGLLIRYGVWLEAKENAAIRFTMYLSDCQRHQHGTIPAHGAGFLG